MGFTVLVAYNVVMSDREQSFLMPPSMRDWLPEDHLAWFVIDVVDQLDLSGFRRSYRPDGRGGAAYDPALMVAVLLYAYCQGIRSSRDIERKCREDIAFRVLAGNHQPDHTTLARFRQRHEAALATLLSESLRLCAAAGLVRLGTIMLDGTKIAADASRRHNRDADDLDGEIARILAEAEAADRAHDDTDDDGSLPGELAAPSSRRARLAAARAQLDEPGGQSTANVTDPDSRRMRTPTGPMQGYNAQTVATDDQIIVAAQVCQDRNDTAQLAPMLSATTDSLRAAGLRDQPKRLVADAGYWKASNLDGSLPGRPELFIGVAHHGRAAQPHTHTPADAVRAAMQTKLDTPRGRRVYRRRAAVIEPVFGDIKHRRGIRRFARRGLAACDSEWKLICATHNLLKLWRAQPATA